ncbi:hypothetical protein DI53_2706 [Sphingobacterium deserti]|uniref:Uncharacterized protein n=1 Tax=Sphingobacterium deserti TaxID=1229276 RepID=A0A0B8T3B5_9SPHI|nr:hypothetical protein DI53_2706 [Sphingobacterium deserti]
MRLIAFFVVVTLLTLQTSNAQEAAKLNASLDKMVSASISGNIQHMLESTTPRLIKAIRGRERAMLLLRETYSSLATQGIKSTVL